jgi:hypothetical protein
MFGWHTLCVVFHALSADVAKSTVSATQNHELANTKTHTMVGPLYDKRIQLDIYRYSIKTHGIFVPISQDISL